MPPPAIRIPVCPVARKSTGTPARGEGPCERQRGVLLPQRAVGSDREQALAGALATGRDRDVGRRCAYVDESAAGAGRGGLEAAGTSRSLACRPLTRSNPASQRLDQQRHPARSDHPAGVGDADDQSTRAFGVGLAGRQSRQARGDRRPLAGPLADASLGHPVAQPEGGLGVRRLGRVTEEQQIRIGQFQDDRGRGTALRHALRSLRLHRGASRRDAVRSRRRLALEELHPRRVAGQVVNLIRQNQFIVIDVTSPERFDELGGLLGRHVAIIVGLDDQHRRCATDQSSRRARTERPAA